MDSPTECCFHLISDGTFTIYMKFDENFNLRPPEVCFHTIPFHPNGKFEIMHQSSLQNIKIPPSHPQSSKRK